MAAEEKSIPSKTIMPAPKRYASAVTERGAGNCASTGDCQGQQHGDGGRDGGRRHTVGTPIDASEQGDAGSGATAWAVGCHPPLKTHTDAHEHAHAPRKTHFHTHICTHTARGEGRLYLQRDVQGHAEAVSEESQDAQVPRADASPALGPREHRGRGCIGEGGVRGGAPDGGPLEEPQDHGPCEAHGHARHLGPVALAPPLDGLHAASQQGDKGAKLGGSVGARSRARVLP